MEITNNIFSDDIFQSDILSIILLPTESGSKKYEYFIDSLLFSSSFFLTFDLFLLIF